MFLVEHLVQVCGIAHLEFLRTEEANAMQRGYIFCPFHAISNTLLSGLIALIMGCRSENSISKIEFQIWPGEKYSISLEKVQNRKCNDNSYEISKAWHDIETSHNIWSFELRLFPRAQIHFCHDLSFIVFFNETIRLHWIMCHKWSGKDERWLGKTVFLSSKSLLSDAMMADIGCICSPKGKAKHTLPVIKTLPTMCIGSGKTNSVNSVVF